MTNDLGGIPRKHSGRAFLTSGGKRCRLQRDEDEMEERRLQVLGHLPEISS